MVEKRHPRDFEAVLRWAMAAEEDVVNRRLGDRIAYMYLGVYATCQEFLERGR